MSSEAATTTTTTAGQPSSCGGCDGHEDERRLHEALKALDMHLPTIEHEPKRTVEAANTELDRFQTPCIGTKNMFLKSKKNDFVLVTALHTTTTDMKQIQKEAGVKDLRFASAESLAAMLGVEAGAVTPLALVHPITDATLKEKLTVLLDKALMESAIPFVLHPCRNDKSCLLTPAQLQRFLDHLHVAYKVVDFTSNPESDRKASETHVDPATTTNAKKSAGKTRRPDEKANATPNSDSLVAKNVPGETKLGITKRIEDDFSAWYIEVVNKAEMIEYYDVSGCYIIRPWAFFIWKAVQKFFGARIEKMGIEDCYFPMFVSRNCLEREKEHIEGFAPEVAWVTKAGTSDLEVPVAIRPTSETVMYPYYAKWVRSHRDLPVRLNMWNNVIRWEFSHPMPFIRTREFLWQEGHCAWASQEDCVAEVRAILEHYAAVYEELLAVPVVRGRKSDKERFAGADFTMTVETFIPAVGRGCQGGTSHFLGQNFGKMFDIRYQDPDKSDGSTLVPYQNSWGLSTRVIGVMIMVHGDNKGLVMPPRVASVQVIIIPVGITKDTTDAAKATLLETCKALNDVLCEGGLRAKTDLRLNYSPGWRFNDWEVKGVPVRVEIGPREVQSHTLQLVLRHNGARRVMNFDEHTASAMSALMDEIHTAMYTRAKEIRDAHKIEVTNWADFVPTLNKKCTLLAPWCGAVACEDAIKQDSSEESRALLAQQDTREDARAPSMGAKSLCIPLEQPRGVEGLKCICKNCDKPATTWCLFGRSY